jgi:hypothetical protein
MNHRYAVRALSETLVLAERIRVGELKPGGL